MRDKHTPRDEFVERLESKIGREVRQRNMIADSSAWMPPLHRRAIAGLAALVVVSMAIGGAVVAVAYQAQGNERRDALTSSFEQRLALSRQRLVAARELMQAAEQRVAVGMGDRGAVRDAGRLVAELEASVAVIELQMLEIRLTAREPLNAVSSPLVSGRDFVTERWKIESTVPKAALEAEQARMEEARQRVQLGVIDPADVEVIRARVIEMRAGVEVFERKLDIRQRFLKGEFDAAMADLRVLEAESEQRHKALEPKLAVAKQNATRMSVRVETGTAAPLDYKEAAVRVMELETDLAKLDLELAFIRRQIGQRKVK